MTVKHLRLAAGLVVIAMFLSGCGGIRFGSDTGPITLTTVGFGVGDEIAKTRVALADKAIAPIRVRIGGTAFDPQQFLAAVASHTSPDLVDMDRQLIGTYATRGTLEPLSSCIKSQHIDMSQYRPAALAEVTLNGQIYGLPEFYDNRVLMVNDTAVRAAGLMPQQINPSNPDELERATAALTKRTSSGMTTIGFDPKIPEFFPLWARANGIKIISDDGRRANLDDPKLVAVLQYTLELINEQGGWATLKAFRDTFDFFGAKNPFSLNQLTSTVMDDWYLNVLASNSPSVNMTVTPFTDDQGKPIDWATGDAWAIPMGSKHQDQACEWIKTMTDANTWIAAARVRAADRAAQGKPFTGVYTGNRLADQTIFGQIVNLDKYPVFAAAVKAVFAAQDSAFSLPSSPAGDEFKTAWLDAVNRVLSGQQSPAAALAQAQQEAQQALDEAVRDQ